MEYTLDVEQEIRDRRPRGGLVLPNPVFIRFPTESYKQWTQANYNLLGYSEKIRI